MGISVDDLNKALANNNNINNKKMEGMLKASTDLLSNKIDDNKKKIEELSLTNIEQFQATHSIQKALNQRIIQLELCERRRNLIVRGVEAKRGQTVADAFCDKISQLLHLQLTINNIDDIYYITNSRGPNRPGLLKVAFTTVLTQKDVLGKYGEYLSTKRPQGSRPCDDAFALWSDRPKIMTDAWKDNKEAIAAARAQNLRVQWRGVKLYAGQQELVDLSEKFGVEHPDAAEQSPARNTKRPATSPLAGNQAKGVNRSA